MVFDNARNRAEMQNLLQTIPNMMQRVIGIMNQTINESITNQEIQNINRSMQTIVNSDFDKQFKQQMENLYVQEVNRFIGSALEQIDQCQDEIKLNLIAKKFKEFKMYLKILFVSMNQFAKYEYTNQNKPLELAYNAFKTRFLNLELKQSIIRILSNKLQNIRQNVISLDDSIRNIIRMFYEMGYEDSVTLIYNQRDFEFTGQNRNDINLYFQENFEDLFLEESRNFYNLKVQQWEQQEFSVQYYLDVIQQSIDNEERYCAFYYPQSQNRIIPEINRILITTCSPRILDHQELGIMYMLQNNKLNDVQQVFSLVRRTTNTLRSFSNYFEQYIILRLQNIKTIFENRQVLNPRQKVERDLQLVEDFINLNIEIGHIIQNQCDMIIDVQRAQVNAFKDFIQIFEKGSFPRLLSQRCDYDVKNLKIEEQAQLRIKQFVQIYNKYIENKDVFNQDFTDKYGNRLLCKTSNDIDIRLRNELSVHAGSYFKKLEKMQEDITTSEQLLGEFKANYGSTISFDLDVRILTQGLWQNVKQTDNVMNFDSFGEISTIQRSFSDFYLRKFGNHSRKIMWNHNWDSIQSEIRFRSDKTYSLELNSQKQLLILLYFNQRSSFTLDDILIIFGINISQEPTMQKEIIKNVIKPMTDIKLILFNEETEQLNVNPQFTNKSPKLKVSAPVRSRQNADDDQQKKNQDIENQRNQYIDAAMVRVMKSRKTLNLTDLLDQVRELVKNQFQAQPRQMKNRLEHLIQEEYMKRDEEKTDVFHYMA